MVISNNETFCPKKLFSLLLCCHIFFFSQNQTFTTALIVIVSVAFLSVVEYSCLGDWFVGKNHYFAVANTKESRKDEKYRCFLKNRDDDLFIGVSITAECNTLRTVEKSPERLHITPGEFAHFFVLHMKFLQENHKKLVVIKLF